MAICNEPKLLLNTRKKAALFSLIGTSFGAGDGSSTFNLPDITRKVPGLIGQGLGLYQQALGNSAGFKSNILLSKSAKLRLLSQGYQALVLLAFGRTEKLRRMIMSVICININSGGSDQPFNIMQPTGYGNLFTPG